MIPRLILVTSAVLIVSTTSSSLSYQLAECISPIEEKTLVCMIHLMNSQGYTFDEIEEAMIGRPEIEERPIYVGQMTMKAWKYLPVHDDGRLSVVLIPGMTGHQVILKELAKALMTRYNVFTIDSLGYGESSGVLPSDMMHAAVESIEKLMMEFGLEEDQTILAGHSLGGIIAQNFALIHPNLKQVVNIDGGLFDLAHIEGETPSVDQERQMAQMALFQTSPEVSTLAVGAMMRIAGYIKAEVDGTSTAWRNWLDEWYASGGWETSFRIIQPALVIIKATRSDSTAMVVQEFLGERLNEERQSNLPKIRVVSLVTTHEQIALLERTIKVIADLLE